MSIEQRAATVAIRKSRVQVTARADVISMPAQDLPAVSDQVPTSAAQTRVTREGVEALIARHYFGLRALIARRAGDPETGEDLLNDAVCTTWEKWQAGLIEHPEQIAGYIFRVAMNLLRNHRRTAAARLQRRAATGEFDAMPGNAEPPERGSEEQIAARVKKLISEMGSQRDRAILTRFYLDEEDKQSICADLGLDSSQFDKVLHRARRRLKELFESHGERGSGFLSVLMAL